ncbi:hypothetical protein A355_049 [Candidatus Carsonella ruddii HT isolate Thao2000]|uniref:Uncharacterized protein n=1 Tax=Candidatus Carsonella ruddii HT isolate Thao2000 TaxID=1202539 RepID=J3TW93_CARRU|nr:hypothetical protein [Candidatus Carsonella ruddii]AFP84090.1 hypothetical protein A355_049 [Candidatus Carsonella ruddii HT isolate Thao2000]
MKIIKNYILIKKLNNNSKIINFNNNYYKSIKKFFLMKYNTNNYIFNLNKNKNIFKKNKKIKKYELFV